MIREELRELKTGPRDLRNFGVMVGAVLNLLALWFWLRHKPIYPFLLLPAVPLLVLGLTYPASLKWVYVSWMALAFALGQVVSMVLLTVFFFLVVTPLGLVARCFGKDFLDRRLDRQAASYWRARDRSKPPNRSRYEQQF